MLLEHHLGSEGMVSPWGGSTPWGSVTEFSSADIMDIMKQKVINPKNKHIASMRSLLPKVRSAYGMDRKAVEGMFTDGWAEGAEIAMDLADKLEATLPTPRDLRRALHYADHGDELVIDNLYSGRFDNLFRTRKRKYRPTQTVITVGMHLCTLWSGIETTMLSGAVGIALARVLERYGYRVELISLLTASDYVPSGREDTYGRPISESRQHVAVVRVKEAYAPLNAAEIAAVHHPATAHTLIKSVMGRGEQHLTSKCSCNDCASQFATSFMEETGRRFDYCFDWIGYEGSAERELIKAVKSMGGTIFNEEDVAAL